MVAKPSDRKSRPPEDAARAEEPFRLFQEVIESQMDLWRKWNGKAGKELEEAAREVAPIVAQHWAKMLETIWLSAQESWVRDDPLASQDELRRYLLTSHNEMMKKVLMTKSFAGKAGGDVKRMVEGVKAWNEAMEEVLKAMRLPTKSDIDELHEALYNLSKRVDYLAKEVRNGGSRRAAR